jgi:hypothetical protein
MQPGSLGCGFGGAAFAISKVSRNGNHGIAYRKTKPKRGIVYQFGKDGGRYFDRISPVTVRDEATRWRTTHHALDAANERSRETFALIPVRGLHQIKRWLPDKKAAISPEGN